MAYQGEGGPPVVNRNRKHGVNEPHDRHLKNTCYIHQFAWLFSVYHHHLFLIFLSYEILLDVQIRYVGRMNSQTFYPYISLNFHHITKRFKWKVFFSITGEICVLLFYVPYRLETIHPCFVPDQIHALITSCLTALLKRAFVPYLITHC
jgi:hypothetical protein